MRIAPGRIRAITSRNPIPRLELHVENCLRDASAYPTGYSHSLRLIRWLNFLESSDLPCCPGVTPYFHQNQVACLQSFWSNPSQYQCNMLLARTRFCGNNQKVGNLSRGKEQSIHQRDETACGHCGDQDFFRSFHSPFEWPSNASDLARGFIV